MAACLAFLGLYKGMPKIAELRLGFREIILSPLQAIRVGNWRLILFTCLMGLLSVVLFSGLTEAFYSEILLPLNLKGNLNLVSEWLLMALGIIVSLPLVLVGVAIPVRVIWATGSCSIKNLLVLIPGSILVALRSCIRHLPQFASAVLPALVGFYLIVMLEERGPSQQIARAALLLSALLAILLALRQIVILVMALMLAISGQVDMRIAHSVILRARSGRLRHLVFLTACMILVVLSYGLVLYFELLPLGGWWLLFSVPIFVWYFLVCYTLLAIQIGFEQGDWR